MAQTVKVCLQCGRPQFDPWVGKMPWSSTLAWKIPWAGEPDGLQSMRSESQTGLSDFTYRFTAERKCGCTSVPVWNEHRLSLLLTHCDFSGSSDAKESACNAGDPGSVPGWRRSPGERNGNPLQYACLRNPKDGGAWWATAHAVAESDVTERLTLHFQGVCVGRRAWSAVVCRPADIEHLTF